MSLNMPLIERTLAQIVRNSGAWKQEQWGDSRNPQTDLLDVITDEHGDYIGLGSCKTGMCFAGWGLTLSKVRLRWVRRDYDAHYYADETEHGEQIDVEAMRRFGISMDQCCREHALMAEDPLLDEDHECLWDHVEGFPALFSQLNGLDDLYDWVARYEGIDEDSLRARVTNLALMGEEVASS